MAPYMLPDPTPKNCTSCGEEVFMASAGTAGLYKFHKSTGEFFCPDPPKDEETK